MQKINENFNIFDKCLSTCENQTLIIFSNFIKLIKDKEENEEIDIQKNIFILNFCKCSLGYSTEENSLGENEKNNVDKLFKLINYINKGNNKTNNILYGNKEKVLSNVYEQLKIYFDNKNKNSEQIKYDEDMFEKIRGLINSKEELNEKNKNNEIKLNKNKNEIYNFNLNNLNSSTFKLSKTMKINLRQSGRLFTESKEIVDEFENNKDIPWIREEDC